MIDLNKKPREQAVEIAIAELKAMKAVFAIGNAVVVLISIAYCFMAATAWWQFLTGLLLGNTAAILNFYAIGATAAKSIRSKDAKHAKKNAITSYLMRYIGGFTVFGILLHFNLINPFTAVVPLLFPRLHYLINAIIHK